MAQNPLKVLNDLYIREQAVTKKGLVISGSVTGSTGLHVKRDAIIEGDLEVGGTMQNSGYAQAGALQVDGILDVGGNAYISGSAEITGSLVVVGQFQVVTASAENLYVSKNASFGQQKLFEIHQQGQSGAGTPTQSYVYAGQKFYLKPDSGYTSGSVFAQDSLIDLGDIDTGYAQDTEVIDLAKTLKNLDNYLYRLSQVVEF